NIATVSITVNAVNTAPVALDDSYSINKNSMLVVSAAGVLTNDTDAQSNPLTAVLSAGPTHGSLTLSANGSFTYTPATDHTGPDSFTYRANDGSLNSNVATVSITVNAPVTNVLVNGSFESDYTAWTKSGNQAIATYPTTDGRKLVAFNGNNLAANGVLSQTFATVSGQTYTLSFDAGILSYVKKNQVLEVKIAGPGSLLSQTITLQGGGNGSIEWTSKSYTFVAGSSTATITFKDRSTTTIGLDLLLDNIRIGGPPAFPNSAPVAAGDSYSVNKNTALVIPTMGVLTNDTDPQSDALTAVLDSGPAHGTLVLNPNGGFTYTPATGFVGGDSFTYHASDSALNSNTATVTISVTEVSAGILVNPSFESNFSGWTTTGNQSIEFYPATDGTKVVAFNGQNLTPNAVLSQTFATTVGKTYTLAFDAGVFSYTTDPQSLLVTVKGSASLLSRSVNLTGTGGGAFTWAAQSFSFTADSASTILTFRDQSTATIGLDLLLDNVRVNPQPSASASSVVIPPPVEEIPTPSLTVNAGNATVSTIAAAEGYYFFERSEDLVTWEVIDSGWYAAGGTVEFHDARDPLSTEPLKPRMFYRIRLPDIPSN
ncbi:MAG: Ig-like domain-containing protein, partial [Luteolibacter sp.]